MNEREAFLQTQHHIHANGGGVSGHIFTLHGVGHLEDMQGCQGGSTWRGDFLVVRHGLL